MPDKAIICFTGTGNSFYVARSLQKKLSYNIFILGPKLLADPSVLGSPSELGIVFPTYKGLPTKNLYPFMSEILAKKDLSKLKYCFCVTTCGFMPGDSLEVARLLALKAGIECSYSDWVRMPETFVPVKPIESGVKLWAIFHAADEKISAIAKAILNKQSKSTGREMFGKEAMERYDKELSEPETPIVYVLDSCTGCGKCKAVCPRKAITMSGGKPVFNGKCENCMACYHFCPEHAIGLTRRSPGPYTYYQIPRFTGYNPDYK